MKNRQKYILTFLGIVCLSAGLLLTVQEAVADVQNGGFEEGQTVWAETSSQNLLPLIFPTNLVSLPPHGGTFGAWLCGAVNEVSSISQQVTVPLGAPTLIYWEWIDSIGPCDGKHEGQILVDGEIIRRFNLCETTATNGWARRVVDLNNFKGQSISLEIRGSCNSPDERVSNLFLDDLALQATGAIQHYLPLIFKNKN